MDINDVLNSGRKISLRFQLELTFFFQKKVLRGECSSLALRQFSRKVYLLMLSALRDYWLTSYVMPFCLISCTQIPSLNNLLALER